jgi:serine kinase of HPr protein (carbohydrate metabolism regulator)
MERRRGTTIAVDGHGVLLRGDSDAGKSDLALRVIEAGGQLVSDDYTDLVAEDGRLIASAPAPLHGLLEIRGIGVVRLPAAAAVPLVVIIDLAQSAAIERMPAPASEAIMGVRLPVYQLAALEASAVAKVRLMVALATGSVLLVQ